MIRGEEGKTGQGYGRRDELRDNTRNRSVEKGTRRKSYSTGWGPEGGGEGVGGCAVFPFGENCADVI